MMNTRTIDVVTARLGVRDDLTSTVLSSSTRLKTVPYLYGYYCTAAVRLSQLVPLSA